MSIASYTRYSDESRGFPCLLDEASVDQELSLTLCRLHERLARFMAVCPAGKDLSDSNGKSIKRLQEQDATGAKRILKEEMRETLRAVRGGGGGEGLEGGRGLIVLMHAFLTLGFS